MKSKIFIPILLGVWVLVSCFNKPKEASPVIAQNKTPSSLDEKGGEYQWSDIKRGDYRNIIDELYTEAKKKDDDLKQLDNAIIDIDRKTNTLLEPYNKYISNNSDYWRSATGLINSIKDSTLEVETKRIFALWESQYDALIKEHQTKVTEVRNRAIALDDQAVLMKLFVTHSMIYNYQKNELPDIKSIQELTGDYNDLINQTKPIIESNK